MVLKFDVLTHALHTYEQRGHLERKRKKEREKKNADEIQLMFVRVFIYRDSCVQEAEKEKEREWVVCALFSSCFPTRTRMLALFLWYVRVCVVAMTAVFFHTRWINANSIASVFSRLKYRSFMEIFLSIRLLVVVVLMVWFAFLLHTIMHEPYLWIGFQQATNTKIPFQQKNF